MQRFVTDFLEDKHSQYLRADHLPELNEKLTVRHLNSYNYQTFLDEAHGLGHAAVIWVCSKADHKHSHRRKQLVHLSKHVSFRETVQFSMIDMNYNDKPDYLKSRDHVGKLYVYYKQSDITKPIKVFPFVNLKQLFFDFKLIADMLSKLGTILDDEL